MHVSATSMKVNINRLMVDPEFYLFNCSEDMESSEFLIVTEQVLDVAPFIDIRLQPYARGQFSVSTRELAELVRHSPCPWPQLHFIFHHAFVCSTLLARCLSQIETFFSLKEPHILRRLADMYRVAGSKPAQTGSLDFGRLLSTHLRLLSKPYSGGERIVVKATNVANNLLPQIAEQLPDSKMLYLFCSLDQFLVSNLKKSAETREKIPALYRITASDGNFHARYPAFRNTEKLDFLQHCALLWLAANHNMLNMAGKLPAGRLVMLSMQKFLDLPRQVLRAVSHHFGHEASALELDRMTSNAIMQRHAKDPKQVYDTSARERENAAIRLRFGQEIAGTIRWLEAYCQTQEVYELLENQGLTAPPDKDSPPVGGREENQPNDALRISSRN